MLEDLFGGFGPHERSGFSFEVAAQAVMSAASCLMLRCAERLSFLVVSAENQRSRFIHDP